MDIREIGELGPAERRGLFDRDAGVDAIREDVDEILDRVREAGDVALREFAREFDDVEVGAIDVTDRAERAAGEIDAPVREAIGTAIDNVRDFHERAKPTDWREEFDGRTLGQRYRPVGSAGVYVPGGTASYPSSAIMGIVPAKVAGVDHIAVATPPAENLDPVTLAAIHEAGADAVYQVGGAQAIGALAYGTDTVSATDVVVGPGNRWVTAAKASVRGDVRIDFLAGPSEILILADGDADASLVAADLVAQAEHDTRAAVALVTTDRETANTVADEIQEQVPARERSEVIQSALEHDASGLFHARSMSEAVLFAEEYAPEHLSIQATDDEAILSRIDSAGSVFLGPASPVAAGDYAAGPNHVLPTGGAARVVGGLSTETFLRATTTQRLSHDGLAALRETITTLAEAEGLEAHAASIEKRFD